MDDAPPQEPDPTRTPSAEAGPPLFHTLRVETDAPEGPRTATAFILEYRAEDNRYPFLVTARHVVQEAPEGRITFVPERRARPDLSKGYTLDIENFAKLWFVHPDPGLDVAVTPFVPLRPLRQAHRGLGHPPLFPPAAAPRRGGPGRPFVPFVKHIEDSGIPLYFRPLQRLAEEAPGRLLAPLVLAAYPQGLAGNDELLPFLVEARVASPRLGDYSGRDRFVIAAPLFPGCAGAPLLQRQGDGGWALAGMLDSAFDPHQGLIPLAEAAGPGAALGGALRARVCVALARAYLKEKGFI